MKYLAVVFSLIAIGLNIALKQIYKKDIRILKTRNEYLQDQVERYEYLYAMSQQDYFDERDKRIFLESEQNSWGCRKGTWCESCHFAREMTNGTFLCVYGRCHNHTLRLDDLEDGTASKEV